MLEMYIHTGQQDINDLQFVLLGFLAGNSRMADFHDPRHLDAGHLCYLLVLVEDLSFQRRLLSHKSQLYHYFD